jgi:hypothetical protein
MIAVLWRANTQNFSNRFTESEYPVNVSGLVAFCELS